MSRMWLRNLRLSRLRWRWSGLWRRSRLSCAARAWARVRLGAREHLWKQFGAAGFVTYLRHVARYTPRSHRSVAARASGSTAILGVHVLGWMQLRLFHQPGQLVS